MKHKKQLLITLAFSILLIISFIIFIYLYSFNDYDYTTKSIKLFYGGNNKEIKNITIYVQGQGSQNSTTEKQLYSLESIKIILGNPLIKEDIGEFRFNMKNYEYKENFYIDTRDEYVPNISKISTYENNNPPDFFLFFNDFLPSGFPIWIETTTGLSNTITFEHYPLIDKVNYYTYATEFYFDKSFTGFVYEKYRYSTPQDDLKEVLLEFPLERKYKLILPAGTEIVKGGLTKDLINVKLTQNEKTRIVIVDSEKEKLAKFLTWFFGGLFFILIIPTINSIKNLVKPNQKTKQKNKKHLLANQNS